MYSSRIPNLTLVGDLQSSITQNRTEYSKQQVRISNQQKYLSRSENPIETNEAASIDLQSKVTTQWMSNVDRVTGWEQATDSVMQGITTSMNRIKELLVQANDGTNAANRTSIAAEVDQIIEKLVQDGNSQYIGNYVFSGVGGNQPFLVARDATTGQITQVAYSGGLEQRRVQVSDTTGYDTATNTDNGVTYGLMGSDMRTYLTPAPPGGQAAPYPEYRNPPTPPDPVPAANQCSNSQGVFLFRATVNTADSGQPDNFAEENVDIFGSLIEFRNRLKSADYGTGWDNLCRKLQASVDHVVTKEIDVITSQKKFEGLTKNLKSIEQSQNNRYSEVADIDSAAAISDFYQMQATLQASLQMISKVNSMSIIDYI